MLSVSTGDSLQPHGDAARRPLSHLLSEFYPQIHVHVGGDDAAQCLITVIQPIYL